MRERPEFREREVSEEEVLKRNSELLEGRFREVVGEESVGGNAGSVRINGKNFGCAAANGMANPDTGELLVFGNSQNLTAKERAKGTKIAFRVAVDFDMKDFSGSTIKKIVSLHLDPGYTEVAIERIKKTVELYNRTLRENEKEYRETKNRLV